MQPSRLRRWLTVVALLTLPALASAQEATLSGTVTDTTGGALPGVTVRAVHEASGNNFEAVTDERGEFRLAVRVGAYQVTADLAGFVPVTRTLTLLVGQQAVVNLQMGVSGLEETVTVTGEAPLLDVTESSLGGNIDPRQLQELPVQGRNWVDLVMLAPGSRVNAVAESPSDFGGTGPSSSRLAGDFQLNVDGQDITQNVSTSVSRGHPRISRDAIAEFVFVSSRFDATQGRSSGLIVNAITKSGTNTPSGTFSGYFRHDRFNAADHVAGRVLPYQNQQLVGTFGGPIRKDKLHIFAHYEYEREPLTAIFTTPYPHFNLDLRPIPTGKKGGVRLDTQVSPRTRFWVRGTWGRNLDPPGSGGGSGTSTPSSLRTDTQRSNQFVATLTQVFGDRLVNELKAGYIGYHTERRPALRNPNARFLGLNGPQIQIADVTAGAGHEHPDDQGQDVYSVRDDVTYSFRKGGRHTLKLGAEYLYQDRLDLRCVYCDGLLDATGGPVPVPVETIFPDLFDASTWNLAPLSPISIRWRQGFKASLDRSAIRRYSSAIWVQDDWMPLPRLTLNLGVRYDVELNAFASDDIRMLPFLRGSNQPDDTNNVAPRTGFSFSLNDHTVLRGGYGVYFGTVGNAHFAKFYVESASIAAANDGRSDFASNPFNGPAPTFEALAARYCTTALVPECVRREVPTGGAVYGPNFTMPYSHQTSFGLQRQLSDTMAIEADYVYTGHRDTQRDLPVNIRYNPTTGVNYPFSDLSKRPFPEWGAT